MKNIIISFSALIFMSATSVSFAHNCPNLSEQVTTKIEQMSNADPDVLAMAETLRTEGMALHESGDHDGSVAKLGEALQVLSDAE